MQTLHIASEALDTEREELPQHRSTTKITVKLNCLHRICLIILFLVTSTMAYALMLIVMTFEIGLLVSVSLGLFAGAILFQ